MSNSSFTADSLSIGKVFKVNNQIGTYVGYIAGWYTFRDSDNALFYTVDPSEVADREPVKAPKESTKVTTEEA